MHVYIKYENGTDYVKEKGYAGENHVEDKSI